MPRRVPSFPIRFELFKPTRFSKEESVMYFAHEWDAYQKSLHHDDQPATTPAKAVPSPATKAAVTPEINQATVQATAAPPTPARSAISSEPSPLPPSISGILGPVPYLTNFLRVLYFLAFLENSSRFFPPLPPLLHLPAS
jgi:hypothetical protein